MTLGKRRGMIPHRRFNFAAALVPLLAFLAVAAVPAPASALHATSAPPGAAQGQLGGLGFALAGSFGQVGGTATELAYAYPRGDQFKLSELEWDIEDVAIAGIQGSAAIGSRLSLNLGFWWALNEGDGSMRDRDWDYLDDIDQGLVDVDDISDDDWTHESNHPHMDVEEGTIFDANLSFRALQSGPFSVSAILGYKRENWQWSAWGGSFLYSVYGFRDYGGWFLDADGEDLHVIDYEQEYRIPYVGVGATWQGSLVQVEAHVLASSMVDAEDHDYHVLRDLNFDAEFSEGNYVGLGLGVRWFFLPQWFAGANVEYEKIDGLTGDVTVTSREGSVVYRNGSGIEMEAAALTFSAGYRF